MTPLYTIRQILFFLMPAIFLSVFLEIILYRTGETKGADVAVEVFNKTPEAMYYTRYSSRYFAFHSARWNKIKVRPDILILGSSRLEFMTGDAFAPLVAYNAAQSCYVFSHYNKFLETIPQGKEPKILIVLIDFFMFHSKHQNYRYNSLSPDLSTAPKSRINLYGEFSKDLLQDTNGLVYKTLSFNDTHPIGLGSILFGIGFRADGSFYSHTKAPGFKNPSEWKLEINRRLNNGDAPFYSDKNLDMSHMDTLKILAKKCRSRNILLVGVSPPMQTFLYRKLTDSKKHKNWKEFMETKTSTAIQKLGIQYFNFSHIDSFEGLDLYFRDPFHPDQFNCLKIADALKEKWRFKDMKQKILATSRLID